MDSQRVGHDRDSEHKKQQGAEEGTFLSFMPFIPGENWNTQICSITKDITICLMTGTQTKGK